MQKLTGLFIIITVLLSILGVGYVWQNEQEKEALRSQLVPAEVLVESPSPDEMFLETTPEPLPSTTSMPKTKTGSIQGSLGFPSSGIPDEMEICAENQITNQTYCTDEHLKGDEFQYGFGYNLEVPEGNYFVYAQIPNDAYKAYYSEFVTCGLKYECPSHRPIAVTVTADSVTKNIDPQDWYNNDN